ncbi:MAG: hypothetical protein KKA81_07205 [Bacteroidetes bacterium]|nr:hypothetical protein [Bacteroidota bacterium]
MTPEIIPTPDTLPVNWLWFEILLLVTFLLHIIVMNFIVGGSILTIFDSFRKKTFRDEVMTIPTLIALTINFGVPPLLFVQVLYGNLFYTSSVIMAVPWILVIPFLLIAYYGAYIYVKKNGKSHAIAQVSLYISTAVMLIIAFIYVNNNTLMLDPSRWSMYFSDPAGTNLNWGEPTLFPRYLHFIVGAISIAALGKALFYHYSRKADPELKEKQIASGLKVFGYTTIVQIIIGLWFLISLPKNIMMLFMGQNIVYTFLLILGIVLALITLHSAFTRKLMFTVITTIILLITMILMRDLLRHAYLEGVFDPAGMTVTGKYSSLILFLAAFIIGLYSLYYMIKLMFKPKTQ